MKLNTEKINLKIATNGSELAPFNRRLVGNGASLLLPAGGGTQN